MKNRGKIWWEDSRHSHERVGRSSRVKNIAFQSPVGVEPSSSSWITQILSSTDKCVYIYWPEVWRRRRSENSFSSAYFSFFHRRHYPTILLLRVLSFYFIQSPVQEAETGWPTQHIDPMFSSWCWVSSSVSSWDCYTIEINNLHERRTKVLKFKLKFSFSRFLFWTKRRNSRVEWNSCACVCGKNWRILKNSIHQRTRQFSPSNECLWCPSR